MNEEAKKPDSRWLWWLAGGTTAAIVLAAAAGAWYYLYGPRVWTDGQDVRLPERAAHLRQVLWLAPRAADGEVNSGAHDCQPALSTDGQALYFVRGLAGQGADIYVSRRVGDRWAQPAPLAAVNTESDELSPCLAPDGRFLLFSSNRPGGQGGYDLWAASRTPDGWGEPFNLGPSVNGPCDETSPAVTPDRKRLIFATNRPRSGPAGAKGDYNLFVLDLAAAPAEGEVDRRGTENSGGAEKEAAGKALPLSPSSATSEPSAPSAVYELQGVNTPYNEQACCLSPAGDFVYFASDRPGGAGAMDLYRARLAEGRCEPAEHLGVALNSAANDTDPRVVTGGFGLIFSSDRPASQGGFDLYTAESREVYADRSARTPPRLAWSIWALLAAAAVLVPLLLFLRAAGYRHLNLLQKCIVISLLIHVLMTMSMSLFFIYQPILDHVAEAAGLTTAVNLELAQEVQMRMQIRRQITDLPMTELPVSDPMLAELNRPRPADIQQAAPQMAELNVPHVEIKPAEMTVQPEAPRLLRPAPAESVSLPQPPVRAETPTVRLAPAEPVAVAEQAPRVVPEAPKVPQRAPEPTRAATDARTEVELTAARARPSAESIAQAAAADRPPAPAVEQVASELMPVLESEKPTVRVAPPKPVTAAEQTLQAAPEVAAAPDRRLATTAPGGEQAREVALSAGRAEPAAESLAQAVEADRPPAPAAVEAPAPLPAAAMEAAPAAAAPDLPGQRVSARAVAPPAAVAVEATSTPQPTASPRAEASTAALAVPTAVRAGRSLAIAAAVSRPPQAAAAPVAIDIAAATDSPEIKLPALAGASASSEPVPVATSIREARELEARPLVGRTTEAQPELLVPTANFMPVQPKAASLLRPEVASLGRPTAVDPDTTRIAPASMVTPLLPLTALGRLTSPDAFFQRHFEQRRKFVEAMGGSKETEAGVAKALAWLAGCQQPDGRWTFFTGSKPDRRAKPGSHDAALTSLAALCFLAADHTPGKPGPYTQCVAKAIDFVIDRQKPDGDLRGGGDMYAQALATLAVAEAAAMTRQARYRAAAIKAFRFIVNAQNRRTGGWRYQPGDEGDTSVFGWQVMALHSVERGGIPIPTETRKLSFRWLDRATRSAADLRAGYQNDSPTLSMTAEAVLSRVFLGQQLTDEQISNVCEYLKQPSRNEQPNYYYWYYASLVLHQMQNEAWEKWNTRMRETLLHLQRPDGSWDPKSKYASRAGVGRVYSTALATLTLEVYYRYLPILGGKGPAPKP